MKFKSFRGGYFQYSICQKTSGGSPAGKRRKRESGGAAGAETGGAD